MHNVVHNPHFEGFAPGAHRARLNRVTEMDNLQEHAAQLRSYLQERSEQLRAELREQMERLRTDCREQTDQFRTDCREQTDQLRTDAEVLRDQNRHLLTQCQDLPRLRDQCATAYGMTFVLDRDSAEIRQAQHAYTGSLNALHATQSDQNRQLRRMADEMASLNVGQARLVTRQDRLSDQVDVLVEGQSALRQTVDDLVAGQAELRSDVTELRSDVTELRSDVTELRSDVTELRQDLPQLHRGLDRLTDQVTALTEVVTQLAEKRAG